MPAAATPPAAASKLRRDSPPEFSCFDFAMMLVPYWFHSCRRCNRLVFESATHVVERVLIDDRHGGGIARLDPFQQSDDAIALTEAALLRDPLCSVCLYVLMKASINDGQFDKALEASERRMRVATGGWITRGNIYLLKGGAHKALELYDKEKQYRVAWLGGNSAPSMRPLPSKSRRDPLAAWIVPSLRQPVPSR